MDDIEAQKAANNAAKISMDNDEKPNKDQHGQRSNVYIPPSFPGVAIGQPVAGSQPAMYGLIGNPNNLVIGNPVALNGIAIEGAEVVNAPPGVDVQKCAAAWQRARSIMCCIILDVLICVLSAFTLWAYVIFLLPLCVIGYYGAKKYDGRLLMAYVVYHVIMIGIRSYFFLASAVGDDHDFITAILLMLYILCEIYIATFVVKFNQFMRTLSQDEVAYLKSGKFVPTERTRHIIFAS